MYMNRAESYHYVDDAYNFYQDKKVGKKEKVLNEKFSSLFEWFIDNKLSILLGHDQVKTVAFCRKKYVH